MAVAASTTIRHAREVRSADPLNEAFVARRAGHVSTALRNPAARLASFLAYLSRNNEANGFDPSLITDDLRCGTVASWLNVSVDELEAHLRFLQQMGLVDGAPSGDLVVVDRDGLERLVDALY